MRIRAALAPLAIAGVLAVVGCAPEPASGGSVSPAPGATETATVTVTPSATASPGATASAANIPIPSDCRAILTPAVLSQLEGTPLNDPALGPSGVQSDGSLVCLWRDPRADTTYLRTVISRVGEGVALDQLNQLADAEGFTCYKPDAGTRCEKTYPNPQYPVTDGRTLYYRQNVLIDTSFSNLAPDGYTAAIVAAMFPVTTPSPTPSPTP